MEGISSGQLDCVYIDTNKEIITVKGKLSLHKSQVANQANAYPSFCSMRQQGVHVHVFLPPLPWMGRYSIA